MDKFLFKSLAEIVLCLLLKRSIILVLTLQATQTYKCLLFSSKVKQSKVKAGFSFSLEVAHQQLLDGWFQASQGVGWWHGGALLQGVDSLHLE